MKTSLSSFLLMLALAFTLGCEGASTGTSSSSSSGGSTSQTFVQVERLARPAINEGLIVTNSFLNAFNAIAPSDDLSPAAAAVRTEAVATMDAVDLADAVANVDSNAIVGAFLPDVMRIDTTLNIAVDTQAYSASFNAAGSPVAGRKIQDDVMDITLTVLVGAAVTDNVTYTRPAAGPGSTNQGIGHQRLNGQTVDFGAATFPFLAPPN